MQNKSWILPGIIVLYILAVVVVTFLVLRGLQRGGIGKRAAVIIISLVVLLPICICVVALSALFGSNNPKTEPTPAAPRLTYEEGVK
jgi:amino acid transporter